MSVFYRNDSEIFIQYVVVISLITCGDRSTVDIIQYLYCTVEFFDFRAILVVLSDISTFTSSYVVLRHTVVYQVSKSGHGATCDYFWIFFPNHVFVSSKYQ